MTGNPQTWPSYPAEEWSDAIVCSMKLGGIERLFFVSGTELTFLQEAIAKAKALGRPVPSLITMTHENVALNAAIGASMVSGQPAATATHVDAGTLHMGAAIHTAWRSGSPVLMLSGIAPRALPGSMPGSRDSGFQYVQEPHDQGAILRQYTKLDHRLDHRDNPGLVVSRLLQIAMSAPHGPVSLQVARETAMLPLPGTACFPSRDELGLARPAQPTPEDAAAVARWLIEARKPCIYTGRSGEDHETVGALVRLAELLAIPVMESSPSRLNFPHTHDFYDVGYDTSEADVLLIIESEMHPALGQDSPPAGAKVVRIGADPVQSRLGNVDYGADLWLSATPANVITAIYETARSMLEGVLPPHIEKRRAKLIERRQKLLQREQRKADDAAAASRPSGRLVAHELSKLVDSRTIILNDGVSNARFVDMYLKREEPGTYFRSGSSGGGWGPGAALGAKLTAPDRDVVLASGDGFFMFGEPLSALWAANYHSAPFLSVVFVNGSYRTGTAGLKNDYPDGYAVRSGVYAGGVFDPAPDFAKLAEAAGAYGAQVSEPSEVGPALKRAMKVVRSGTAAVVAVRVPGPPLQSGRQLGMQDGGGRDS